MDKFLRYLSRNLRKYRKEVGLTQEELSHKCGFSRTYVGKIERGNVSPSFSTLSRIAKTLGVTLVDLLDSPDYEDERKMYREVLFVSQTPTSLINWEGEVLDVSESFQDYFDLSEKALKEERIWDVMSKPPIYYEGDRLQQHLEELPGNVESSKIFEVAYDTDPVYISITSLNETEKAIFVCEILSEAFLDGIKHPAVELC